MPGDPSAIVSIPTEHEAGTALTDRPVRPRWITWLRRVGCGFLILFVAAVLWMIVGSSLSKPWNAAYRWQLGSADRVVVRAIQWPYDEATDGLVERDIRDPSVTAELIDAMVFVDEAGLRMDGCGGSAWLTFYRGDRKVASVSFHHGQSLRLDSFPLFNLGFWLTGNARLAPESGKALMAWFERNDFPGIAREDEWRRAHFEVLNRKLEAQLQERAARIVEPGGKRGKTPDSE